jgi:hypothetical protein
MSAKTILRTAEKFLVDNSPGILTGLGVAGSVTAAVLAGKGGFKASKWLEEMDPNGMNDLKENVKQTWKFYIPAASVGVVTIVAIIGANQIGSRRAAAFAAAYKLSEQLSDDYKKKVLETLGVKNEEKVRTELASERINKISDRGLVVIAGSEVLMYDELSGRVFKGKVEDIKKAVNEINHQVLNFNFASLTEFYDKIGLTSTSFSDSVGWNLDELLEVQFTAIETEDQQPAMMIGYNHEPIKGFDRCM